MSLPLPFISMAPGFPPKSEPRLGWEKFEATDTSGITEAAQHPQSNLRTGDLFAANLNHSNQINDDSDESELNTGKTETKKHEKITSMFQANRPSTSCGVETSCRPQSARTASTRSQILRPSTALPQSNESKVRADGVILTAIFSIDKISYDVELYDDKISWTPVSPGKMKPSTMQVQREDLSTAKRGEVYIHEICSVRLKNIKSVKTGSVTTIGFAIFTAQSRPGNKLREESTLFFCFSRDICIQWATRIKAIITARPERPKHLLVISNGSFQPRFMWDDIIESKLKMACVKCKFTEIYQSNSATEYVHKMLAEQAISRDSESYDGILVLGKLSFFSEVLNAILDFKKEVLRSGTWLPIIPTLGFIPTVSMSYVGIGMHGCTDVETAIFHAIYGCTQSVAMCSFYDREKNFIKYGLVASYGFSGGDTSYESTSKGFGVIQGSIKRGFALTKALVQRRVYPCEISYQNLPPNFEPFDEDEIFEDTEFGKHNKLYIHDEDSHFTSRIGSQHSSHGSDSEAWPQNDKWETVPRRNYLDVTVTSLPQEDDEDPHLRGQLSAILVKETMSRKNLLMGMGSQVSLSSSMSKTKPDIQNQTDIIHGSEFIVQSCSDSNYSSRWSIDGCCLKADIQELHVKTDEWPLIIYGRALDQPLCTQGTQNVLNLEPDSINEAYDSLA